MNTQFLSRGWRPAVLAALLAVPTAAAGQVVLENPRLRLVLGPDAVWRSLVDKRTGADYAAAAARVRMAEAVIDGRVRPAERVSLKGDRLTVWLSGGATRLIYRVACDEDWIAFRLVGIQGERPERLTLLAVPVAIVERCGRRLGAAWNDDYAVCLRAINLQTDGAATPGKGYTLLRALTQDAPGPRLEGSGAAILAAPPRQLKPILARLARQFDLPRNEQNGVASKDLPMARQSYWFLNFGEDDVDRVIDYCRKTGFRQVLIGSSSWCSSVGHFTFNTSRYPDGLESLRRVVARLHEHGILAGMHTFASKISKTDPYVTPVPNRGFVVDLSATLAGGAGAEDTVIRTASDLSQWPGSPVCGRQVWEGGVEKHQEVIIEDEIIRYERIGPEGAWNTFFGCQRGAWGTRPAAHPAGSACRHYAVDGCINGYIIDQESPLFQETTSRLAHIFNYCDFDMVYFDGSEDVDRRRYHYYCSNAHATAMRKFVKRPIIHMGGGRTHGLWHSFTRFGTIDQYPGTYLAYLRAGGSLDRWPTCKDHIDRTVERVIASEADMMPAELGWFGIGPKDGAYDGLQFDEIEYLMCKSLAYNAPISLQTSFARMEAHPLTPDILEIVRRYEQLRLSGRTPLAVRERLKRRGKDFLLLPEALSGPAPEFVDVQPLGKVAGTHDVRAWIGERPGGAVASLWHYTGKSGRLRIQAARVEAYDVRGERLALRTSGGRTTVPVDQRRLVLYFPGLSSAAACDRLAGARLELRKPEVLRIEAEDYQSRSGAMRRGSEVGLRDQEATGDFVVCAGRIDRSRAAETYCEYRVEIPHAGRWTLWARVRYPTGGDMSFGLARPGEPLTLSGAQVLGNCGANDKTWHWTGRGGGVTTRPPGSPIVFRLDAGSFVFRIHPREGPGETASNPRLDAFCLTDDPDYRPGGEAAGGP